MRDPEQKTAIELRHLRYFLAVHEELHFGRAAARLHMAQPPLSQAIRKLEDALGVKLFDRTSRTVTATDAGRALAEGARNVLAAFDVALASARRAGHVALTLTVGCVPDLPIQHLLRFLSALQERVPDAAARITHLDGGEQLRSLRAGDLDLAIFHDYDAAEDIVRAPLFPGEPLAILLPPDHRLAARPIIRNSDFAGDPLVIAPREANPGLYDYAVALTEKSGYRFGPIHEAGGSNARDLMLAVAGGSGLALVPASTAELDETGGIVMRRPLDPPLFMPDTVVAWRGDPPRLPPTLLEIVPDLAGELHQATASDTP